MSAAPSTATVGQELVSLCRARRNLDALDRLYAPSIVSIEPVATPYLPAVLSGIDAVRKKNEWWLDNTEVHAEEVSGPYLGEDGRFAVHFQFDTTSKLTGQRSQASEMALYTVKDGKIVHEEFYYHMPGA
jgi:ketosteroid isomerase-like protein